VSDVPTSLKRRKVFVILPGARRAGHDVEGKGTDRSQQREETLESKGED